jgi:hypothetical protein
MPKSSDPHILEIAHTSPNLEISNNHKMCPTYLSIVAALEEHDVDEFHPRVQH